mgnify:CR=1 FL=1
MNLTVNPAGQKVHALRKGFVLASALNIFLVLAGCQINSLKAYSTLADASSACYSWRQHGKSITVSDASATDPSAKVEHYKTYDRACNFDPVLEEYVGYVSEGVHDGATSAEMVKNRKKVVSFRIIRK